MLRNIIVPPLAVWARAYAHVSFRLRGGGSKNGYRECLIMSLSFFLCLWRSTCTAFLVLSCCSYSRSLRLFFIFPVGSMYVDFRGSNRFSSISALFSLAGLSFSFGISIATYLLYRSGGPAFTYCSFWAFVMFLLEFSAKLSRARSYYCSAEVIVYFKELKSLRVSMSRAELNYFLKWVRNRNSSLSKLPSFVKFNLSLTMSASVEAPLATF